MAKLKVKCRMLNNYYGHDLPKYATENSAGFDLTAGILESIIIPNGHSRMIATGLVMEIPVGLEGQVRPRSGMALKYGITVLNSPGTIDADYRGEIGVILINLGQAPFVVEQGMRIAQMVIAPVIQVDLEKHNDLTATQRGIGGFGSSGLK